MARKPKAVQADNDAARAGQPAPGHNSGEVTEAERKSLFFHHLRKRMAHNADLAEINAAKKADGKTAQADGIVLGDIDYAIKAIDADDKKTITDRFVAEGEILTWLGLSTGFQSDLFRDRAPAMERIAKQGELAGYAAKERSSGYGPGSDEDTAWLAAYDDAQKKMQVDLLAAMEKANAKRGSQTGDTVLIAGDDGQMDIEDPFSAPGPDRVAAE